MIQRFIGLWVVGLLAMPILAGAETTPVKHPDFTGSWKVTNIELPQPPSGGNNNRGFGGGGRGFGGGGFGGGGFGGGGRRRGGGYGANPNGNNTNGTTNDSTTGDNDAANRPLAPEVGQVVHMRQTDTQLIVTEEGTTGPVMSNLHAERQGNHQHHRHRRHQEQVEVGRRRAGHGQHAHHRHRATQDLNEEPRDPQPQRRRPDADGSKRSRHAAR